MATQPITVPPSTTATPTLTVRAITDIDGHSTGPTGGIDEPTMRGPIMAAGVIAAPMPAHTAGVTAGHTGGENRAVQAEKLTYLTACAGIVERSISYPARRRTHLTRVPTWAILTARVSGCECCWSG